MSFLTKWRFSPNGSKIESSASIQGARHNHHIKSRSATSSKPAYILLSLSICFIQLFPTYLYAQNRPPTEPASGDHLRRGLLRSRLREALSVLGDRLDRPGKERVTIVGSIILASPPAAIPFRFVWEFPERARLELQVVPPRVLTFDGVALTGSLSRWDEDLIEMLFYDTAERFFRGQAHGLATRFLGTRFRLADGKAADYRGPYYDIYEVTDQINLGLPVRKQPKLYYLNSDSLLLELVRYKLNRNGTSTKIEIQLKNWQKVQGENFPRQTVRLENGQPVFTLTVTSIDLSRIFRVQ